MAQITKDERERRDDIDAAGQLEVRRVLNNAARAFGDPKKFRRSGLLDRILNGARKKWSPPPEFDPKG